MAILRAPGSAPVRPGLAPLKQVVAVCSLAIQIRNFSICARKPHPREIHPATELDLSRTEGITGSMTANAYMSALLSGVECLEKCLCSFVTQRPDQNLQRKSRTPSGRSATALWFDQWVLAREIASPIECMKACVWQMCALLLLSAGQPQHRPRRISKIGMWIGLHGVGSIVPVMLGRCKVPSMLQASSDSISLQGLDEQLSELLHLI